MWAQRCFVEKLKNYRSDKRQSGMMPSGGQTPDEPRYRQPGSLVRIDPDFGGRSVARASKSCLARQSSQAEAKRCTSSAKALWSGATELGTGRPAGLG